MEQEELLIDANMEAPANIYLAESFLDDGQGGLRNWVTILSIVIIVTLVVAVTVLTAIDAH